MADVNRVMSEGLLEGAMLHLPKFDSFEVRRVREEGGKAIELAMIGIYVGPDQIDAKNPEIRYTFRPVIGIARSENPAGIPRDYTLLCRDFVDAEGMAKVAAQHHASTIANYQTIPNVAFSS